MRRVLGTDCWLVLQCSGASSRIYRGSYGRPVMFNSRDTTYLDSPGISRRLQTRFFMLKVSIIVCVTLLLATISVAQNFTAVPLTQFQPGQLYLGAFPGFLYENSNSVPVDHDCDGQTFASQIEPLDAQGRP